MPSWIQHIFTQQRARKALPSAIRKKRYQKEEQKKIIVSESLTTAIRRCLLHLLPILTSIAIIAVNLHGVYLGVDIPGPLKSDTISIMFLQLAAKAHEILIVASLGLIVIQTVRHELLFGDGLPLGLIGSGIAFSNFEFFFKKEFYGGLKYVTYHGNKARKIGFVALLIVSGLTAVLAGPASAVLLVPKSQTYPFGGTDFFLNGSMDYFWPDDLSGEFSDVKQYCAGEISASLGICPAGGFFSLLDRWKTVNYTNFISDRVPPYAANLAGSHVYWPVSSPSSQIPPLYTLGNARPDDPAGQPYTWLVQAHAASSVALHRLAKDWWKVMSSRIDPLRIEDRNIKASVPSVISAVRCSDPQNISSSDRTVQFPTIIGRWDWAPATNFSVDALNTSAVDHLRFHWVHLPDQFGAVSIGAVFESPWVGNETRTAVGCSAQTGWVPTDLYSDKYSFWTGWYPFGIDFGARTPTWTAVGENQPSPPTNGRIALGDDWLRLLTPRTPKVGPEGEVSQSSTIESILTAAGLTDSASPLNGSTLTDDWLNGDQLPNAGKTRLLEMIVSSILADGLSRTGSYRVFDTNGLSSKWSLASYRPLVDFNKRILKGQNALRTPDIPASNLTTLHARMLITGYAFRITLAGYLSMTVLFAHMLMALAHIIWVLSHKRTSRSWKSIAELIALSQNSQAAFGSLANTGAGIHCSRTFARVAKIRISPQPESPGRDHVELIFEDFKGSVGTGGGGVSDAASSTSVTRDVRLGSMVLDEPSAVSHERVSWTFPLDPGRPYGQHGDMELESQSGGGGATDRLIPPVHLPNDEEKGSLVRVNQAYG